ncbi:MAG: ATP-binding protein [Spirochaetia bacterium]|nr:ATP-binding protein [Spirochaetia bacterium]
MEYQVKFSPILIEFTETKHSVEKMLSTSNITYMDMMDIMLAIDEAITNIIIHGYDNVKSEDFIQLLIKGDAEKIIITIMDTGREFDFDATPLPDIRKNLSGMKKGGFGVHLIKSVMNKVEHFRIANVNKLILTKVLAA